MSFTIMSHMASFLDERARGNAARVRKVQVPSHPTGNLGRR